MQANEAKELLKEKLEDYLTTHKGINTKNNFRCFNSGAHKNNDKNPSMSYDKNNLQCHCFSCNAKYDIFDLIGLDYGIPGKENFIAQLNKAGELYNITIEHNSTTGSQAVKQTEKSQNNTDSEAERLILEKSILASQSPKALKYLESRCIKKETADRFNLRYSPNLKGIEALIFPTGANTYNARNINECTKENRYRKAKGEFIQFNIKALETSEKPIFITEGEIDALSIIQAGGEAIALGGQAIETVLNKALQLQIKQPLIIALDNDETGKANTEKLKARKEELKEKGLKLYFPDIQSLFNDCKDANELLQKNDFYFEGVIGDLINNAVNLEETERQEAILKLKRDSVASYKADFVKSIEESKTASFIPTGFKSLDNLLDGGLYSGLYIVGAISSLGKTTLCLQITDQIAQLEKKDVLIFSLEMSKKELIAKSISRQTSILDIERSNSNTNAKTTRGILTGSKYNNYNERELQLIKDATELYFKDIAPNVYIYEGMGNIGAKQIRERVEAYQKITGRAPVVLIDYIQLLQPAPESRFSTDKQITDYNVMELKRISRDFNTAVIGISSFNRDNYTAPVNMASFKESGAIEYSSDVLIGLQYKAFSELSSNASSKDKNKERVAEITADINARAKEKRAIEIQLVILKNRNGNKGVVDLEFFPMFNKFIEPRNR